ncbi:MAG: hypothetical protein JOZ39_08785 [Chloroflexi bacterium]|nr:hypothetical protein [Chloroflexota bacterium]
MSDGTISLDVLTSNGDADTVVVENYNAAQVGYQIAMDCAAPGASVGPEQAGPFAPPPTPTPVKTS